MSELHRHTPTLAVFDPLGQPVRSVAYYKHPNPTYKADVPTRITTNQMLLCGRTSHSSDPRLFAQAQAGYDVRPNLISEYSLSGRPLLSDSVDAGWRLTLWSATGQPSLIWDGRNTRTRHSYNELQRLVAVDEREANQSERCVSRNHYADRDTEARNQCGQLVQVDDSAGCLQFPSYSLQGMPLSETRQFLQELTEPDWFRGAQLEEREGFRTFRRYNALGELFSQTDAAGNTRSSFRSVSGQLRESHLQLAGQQPQVLVKAIQYNALGQVESEIAGNGVISESEYCSATGRLTLSRARKPDEEPLQELSYSYDPVGNILRVEDTSASVRGASQTIDPNNYYLYDSLSQLVEAHGREAKTIAYGPGSLSMPADPQQMANYIETYDYDASGNLQEIKHVGAHNHTRRLTTAGNSNRSQLETKDETNNKKRLTDQEIAADFDANGNLKRLQPGGEALQWDLRNQLQQVSLVARDGGPDDTERYSYDEAGQRVRKVLRRQASGRELVTDVRYLPGLELRTNNATGEVLHVISAPAGRSNVRVLDWKRWRSDTLEEIPNQQFRYSLGDHLGSSNLELNGKAHLLSREGYYPYGGTAWWAARGQLEAKYKVIRYSGKERDATGLYYYGYRYYAPWLGRWISPDPAGYIDGLNRYRAMRNNPVLYMDPNGLSPVNGATGATGNTEAAKTSGTTAYRELREMNILNPIQASGMSAVRSFWDRRQAATPAEQQQVDAYKNIIPMAIKELHEQGDDSIFTTSTAHTMAAALTNTSQPANPLLYLPGEFISGTMSIAAGERPASEVMGRMSIIMNDPLEKQEVLKKRRDAVSDTITTLSTLAFHAKHPVTRIVGAAGIAAGRAMAQSELATSAQYKGFKKNLQITPEDFPAPAAQNSVSKLPLSKLAMANLLPPLIAETSRMEPERQISHADLLFRTAFPETNRAASGSTRRNSEA